MNDEALYTLIFGILREQFARIGRTVTCRRNYQPAEHAADSGSNVYVYKIGNERRIGSPQRVDVPVGDTYETTGRQTYASTFQVNALTDEGPTGLTASDLLSEAALILALESTVDTLRASGVQIERILDVVNTPFLNEQNRYQGSPSFDFVLTYSRQLGAQVIPGAVPDAAIHRV